MSHSGLGMCSCVSPSGLGMCSCVSLTADWVCVPVYLTVDWVCTPVCLTADWVCAPVCLTANWVCVPVCLTADWVCVPVYLTADWVYVRIFLTFFLYVSQCVSNTGTVFVSMRLTISLACVPTRLIHSNVFRYVFQRLAMTQKVVCVPAFPTFPRSRVSYFPAFQRFLLSRVPAFPVSPTHRDLGTGSFVSRLFPSGVERMEAIRTRQTGSVPANKRDDSKHECQVGNNRSSCHQLIRRFTATIPGLQHRTCDFD